MYNWKASVINRRLNFHRHVELQAPTYHDAIEKAKRLLPGYDEVEWCRAIAIT